MRKDFLDVCPEKLSYILKAIVPADNYSYQKRSFEHPTRRQIFANTVNLTLRLRALLWSPSLPYIYIYI